VSTAADVLRAARAAGITIGIDGENLTLEAAIEPPADVFAALKAHKAEILALLRSDPLRAGPGFTRCAGCGQPIDAAERLELADGALVHFRDYGCLIQYADRRREAARAAFWRSVSLDRCGGCGGLIRSGERVCDYFDPKRGPEIVARVHGENLACLIDWNARWHAAEGHPYDAEAYCRHLADEAGRLLEKIEEKGACRF
jgi:hypothetical protein